MRAARGIYGNMIRVFEIAEAESIPTYQAADRMAEERITNMRQIRPQHWGQHWQRTIRERPRVSS